MGLLDMANSVVSAISGATSHGGGGGGQHFYDPKSNDPGKGWPIAKFYFEVNFGSSVVSFQTCDGIEGTVEPYEFRDGNSQNFWKEKRPGMASFGAVTLKKGVFVGDSSMYNWFKNVSTGASFGDMRTVVIHLKDEGGSNVFTWTLEKGFITKFTPTSMDADAGEEVAIEEMEITCTSWTQSGGGASGLLGSIAGALGLGGAVSAVGSLTGSLSASVKLGL